ncbi:hypothetical protein ILYODFUR_035328 [Ilyodon furcidens]|uniref:Uncharacterized protein n=1 Tax=Ilyodon furcidens TaxID=33524 RepID=A0ABV0SRS9_9TELE
MHIACDTFFASSAQENSRDLKTLNKTWLHGRLANTTSQQIDLYIVDRRKLSIMSSLRLCLLQNYDLKKTLDSFTRCLLFPAEIGAMSERSSCFGSEIVPFSLQRLLWITKGSWVLL